MHYYTYYYAYFKISCRLDKNKLDQLVSNMSFPTGNTICRIYVQVVIYMQYDTDFGFGDHVENMGIISIARNCINNNPKHPELLASNNYKHDLA